MNAIVRGLTTSLHSFSDRECFPSMAAASDAIPEPNVSSAVGSVGLAVRASIDPAEVRALQHVEVHHIIDGHGQVCPQ